VVIVGVSLFITFSSQQKSVKSSDGRRGVGGGISLVSVELNIAAQIGSNDLQRTRLSRCRMIWLIQIYCERTEKQINNE
jgi:hypothetical protein